MSGVTLPFVTAVVPCRNEERFIDRCLESVLAMDYPTDRLEILVVDGMSEDRTRGLVAARAARDPRIRLLDNPKRILASAWNVGIHHGRGEIVVALNAHTIFEPDYLRACITYLQRYPDADYVGGVVRTLPQEDTVLGRACAMALSHPFGVGGSRFRTGVREPIWADTAAFGGYRRALFTDVGLFNEELTRSQDMEFHLRLKKAGKRTLLVPEMVGHYYARSEPVPFLRDCYVNGFWATYPLRFTTTMISVRHLVPMVFVVSLMTFGFGGLVVRPLLALFAAVAVAYVSLNVAVSVVIAIAKRDAAYALLMPVTFAALHALYGIGSLVGLIKAVMSRRFWENVRRAPAVGRA